MYGGKMWITFTLGDTFKRKGVKCKLLISRYQKDFRHPITINSSNTA